jgi:hypothetical protein
MSKRNQITDAFTLVFCCYACSVSISTRYRQDSQGIRVRFRIGARYFSLFLQCPDWLWGQPSFLSNGYQGFFHISIKRWYILWSLLSESDIHQGLSILKLNSATWAGHYGAVFALIVWFSETQESGTKTILLNWKSDKCNEALNISILSSSFPLYTFTACQCFSQKDQIWIQQHNP